MGTVITTTKSVKEFPNQMVSFTEKLKPTHYIPTFDYFLARALQGSRADEDQIAIDAANGIISADATQYVLEPYRNSTNNTLKTFQFPGDIRDTGIIKGIVIKLIGEFTGLIDEFEVKVHNSDYIWIHNTELQAKILPIIQQMFINNLNKQGVPTGMESKKTPDIEEAVAEFKQEYQDKRAIAGQDILSAIRDWTNDYLIYAEAYFYWIVCGKYFMYREVVNGEVFKYCIDPRCVYPIRNNALFVEDYEGIAIIQTMTINEVIYRYGDRLEKDDLDFLYKIQKEFMDQQTGTIMIPFSLVKSRVDSNGAFIDFDARYSDVSSDFRFDSGNGEVTVTTLTYKSYKKVFILKYIDPLGVESEKEVDETYKINKAAGDISLEELDVPTTYIQHKIGALVDSYSSLYTPPRYVDIQRGMVNDTLYNKLPFTGKEGLMLNNFDHSIPKRLIAFEVLDRIFRLGVERILYREIMTGRVTLIPESLLHGGDLPPEARMYSISSDGILYYDDTDSSKKDAARNGFMVKEPGVSQTLSVLHEMIKENKLDALDTISWNRQRDGDVRPTDGKSTTNTAISQSMLSMVYINEVFNKSREKDYLADIDFSKVALINMTTDKSAGMFMGSDSMIKALAIDGLLHAETQYGTYIRNGYKEVQARKKLEEFGFAAGQNGEFELAAAALDNDNFARIKGKLDKYTKLMKEQKLASEQADRDKEVQIQQLVNQDNEADRINTNNIEIYKQTEETKRELIKAGANGDVQSDNGVYINSALKEADLEIKRSKLALEERRRQDDVTKARASEAIKRLQLEQQKQLAKMNKTKK
jgi:hypothetical protein